MSGIDLLCALCVLLFTNLRRVLGRILFRHITPCHLEARCRSTLATPSVLPRYSNDTTARPAALR